jgi:hypothetical protein
MYVGGRGINGVLTSVEVYNPVSDVWIAGPPLPTPIDNAGEALTVIALIYSQTNV